jgi:ribonucleoside-diphosphate reductase alpha chain
MTSRSPLPSRRQCETIRFEHGGTRYFGTVGYYDDWRPGELFIDGDVVGSGLQSVNRDLAIATSLALQHGASVDVLRGAFTRLDDGEPTTAVAALLDIMAAPSAFTPCVQGDAGAITAWEGAAATKGEDMGA